MNTRSKTLSQEPPAEFKTEIQLPGGRTVVATTRTRRLEDSLYFLFQTYLDDRPEPILELISYPGPWAIKDAIIKAGAKKRPVLSQIPGHQLIKQPAVEEVEE